MGLALLFAARSIIPLSIFDYGVLFQVGGERVTLDTPNPYIRWYDPIYTVVTLHLFTQLMGSVTAIRMQLQYCVDMAIPLCNFKVIVVELYRCQLLCDCSVK